MELKKNLVLEKERLSNYKRIVSERLTNVPEGRLKISVGSGRTQYYQMLNGKHVYIPSKDKELARQLAQKSYDSRILKCVNRRLEQIEALLGDYEDSEIEKIYLNDSAERRKLENPVELTYQQKLEKWKATPYNPKGFNSDTAIIMTNSGFRVRSKSEKIMADYFDSKGIVYKYECPLYLKSYGTVYPDFTFLSPKTGEEIYWEHEGMMDNEEYARKAIKKIESYETSGFFPGERLILSFETSESVINMKLIESMVQKYLI